MARGDHFFVWRHHRGVPFQHHAIDLGDGTAIHFTDGGDGVAGPGGPTEDFQILRTTLAKVTRDGRDAMHVVAHRQPLPRDEIVRRAMSQLGRSGYHLVFDNCEHFAAWCAVDREESGQISLAWRLAGAAGMKAIAAGTARLASRVGAQHAVRRVQPWIVVADAAQWITEAGGHHVGLRDPQRRKAAGRAVGIATAMGVGATGGVVGVAVAGGLWVAGEFAGEASRASYQHLRDRRRVRPG